MGARLADEIIAALSTQTATVPGSKAAEIVLPKLAESLKETLLQRKLSVTMSRGCSMNTLFPQS